MIFIIGMMLVLYGCLSLWNLIEAWDWFELRQGRAVAHFITGVVFGGAFVWTLTYLIKHYLTLV